MIIDIEFQKHRKVYFTFYQETYQLLGNIEVWLQLGLCLFLRLDLFYFTIYNHRIHPLPLARRS